MEISVASVVLAVAESALNYIVVSTISSSHTQKTIVDLKTDLTTVKGQILNEIKQQGDDIISQIKESDQNGKY